MICVYTLCETTPMGEMGDRLREARERAGFKSARSAAQKKGWKVSTYSAHENGQNDFDIDDARKYAKAFKSNHLWLFAAEPLAVNHDTTKALSGPDIVTNSLGEDLDFELDEPAIVPEIELRAGASYAGGFNEEHKTVDQDGNSISKDAIRANWGIPGPFLRNELHIRPGRAHILPVRGDSMEDALFDGDRAIVNLDDVDVSQGGIFALLDDNSSVIIKQVELVRSSGAKRIKCTSRNPVYAPFELGLDHESVKIIGRVASKITRL